MADYPYLPLWTDAYLADTHHLTFEEHGVYLRLLMLAWRTPGCALPNDPDWIARRLHITREEFDRVASPILLEFFTRRGNRLNQKRLSREFSRVQERSEKQSGRAKSRWNKEKAACRGNAYYIQNQNQNQNQDSIRSSVRPTRSTHYERKSPDRRSESAAPPDVSASRDSAAPDGGLALSSPPAQDHLRDLDWVMSDVVRLEDAPFRQISPGQWEHVPGATIYPEHETVEKAYRNHIRFMCECCPDFFEPGTVKPSLIRKLINAVGPERANAINHEAAEAGNGAAYIAAAINNANGDAR